MKTANIGLIGVLALGAAAARADAPGADLASRSGAGGAGGGAHPHAVLSEPQRTALKRILAPYDPKGLTAGQVRDIRSAMDAAGLTSGPALDAALVREGFSRKRMDILLPLPAQPASAPGHKFPRRQ